jgi:hypothetical protein
MDEATIGRLVDEAAIRNLIARLAHLADDGDVDEYLSLWCEDGTWGQRGGQLWSGLDGLRAGVMQRRADGIQGPGAGTRHSNTTLEVEIESADEARAQSYFHFIGPRDGDRDGEYLILKTGRYSDRFRRTESGWKIASRIIATDIN